MYEEKHRAALWCTVKNTCVDIVLTCVFINGHIILLQSCIYPCTCILHVHYSVCTGVRFSFYMHKLYHWVTTYMYVLWNTHTHTHTHHTGAQHT